MDRLTEKPDWQRSRDDDYATIEAERRAGASDADLDRAKQMVDEKAMDEQLAAEFGKWQADKFEQTMAQSDLWFNAGSAMASVFGDRVGRRFDDISQSFAAIATGNIGNVPGFAGGILGMFSKKDDQGNEISAIGKSFEKTLDGAFDAETWKDISGSLKSGFADFKGIFNGTTSLQSAAGAGMAGLQIGGLTAGVSDMLGLGLDSRGSQIGGAVGSFGGPLGSIIGSVIGGLTFGLFGSSDKGSTTITSVNSSLRAEGNDSERESASRDLAGGVQTAIKDITAAFGVEAGRFAVSIGIRNDDYRVDTTGNARTKGGRTGVRDFGQDQAAAIEYAIRDAFGDGALANLDSRSRSIIMGAGDLDENVQKALQIRDFFANDNSIVSGLDTIIDKFDDLASTLRTVDASSDEWSTFYSRRDAEIESYMDDLRSPFEANRRFLSSSATGTTLADQLSASRDRFAEFRTNLNDNNPIDYADFSSSLQEYAGLTAANYGTSTKAANDVFAELRSVNEQAEKQRLADAEKRYQEDKARADRSEKRDQERNNKLDTINESIGRLVNGGGGAVYATGGTGGGGGMRTINGRYMRMV